MSITRRYVILGTLLAIVLIGGATWVFAYQPFDYAACVNNNSGTIFMIGPDEECGPNAAKIEWNQVGPPGPQGEQGEQGPPGVSEYEVVWNSCDSYNPICNVFCPGSKLALGGGFGYGKPEVHFSTGQVLWSKPIVSEENSSYAAIGWSAALTSTTESVPLNVWATCAEVEMAVTE
jgi:hypothetical protein